MFRGCTTTTHRQRERQRELISFFIFSSYIEGLIKQLVCIRRVAKRHNR